MLRLGTKGLGATLCLLASCARNYDVMGRCETDARPCFAELIFFSCFSLLGRVFLPAVQRATRVDPITLRAPSFQRCIVSCRRWPVCVCEVGISSRTAYFLFCMVIGGEFKICSTFKETMKHNLGVGKRILYYSFSLSLSLSQTWLSVRGKFDHRV